jgi:hypothetical protein
MKSIVILPAILLLLPPSPGAEPAEQTAHFLFVNTVPGPGRTFILHDGESLQPKGFATGRSTGWLSFAGPARSFTITHEPMDDREWEVPPDKESHSVIVILQRQSEADGQNQPPKPVLDVIATPVPGSWLDARNNEAKPTTRILVLNASSLPSIALRIGGKSFSIGKNRCEPCDSGSTELFLPIETEHPPDATGPGGATAGEPLALLNTEENQRHFLVLSDDGAGGLRAITFPLYRQ